MAPLFDLFKVSAGFFIVMTAWFAIQAFIRRRSGCARDRDVLDYMLHGCGSCVNRDHCPKRKSGTL